MKTNRLIVLTLCFFCLNIQATTSEDNTSVVMQVDPVTSIERFRFASSALDEEREFYLALPPSYTTKPNVNYPVLYVLDADQNMEHAVASARLLSQWRGIPELIIVGIPSTFRIRDYTPTRVKSYSEKSGGGQAFMTFITDELVPYIDANYRAHGYRLLFGHSLSGLIAANELSKPLSSFDAYIIAAPSLWWDEFKLLSRADADFSVASRKPTSAYFGIGEHDGFGMKQELASFFDTITQTENSQVMASHQVYEGENHMSAPLQVMYDGLLHTFSDLPLQREEWESLTQESFIAYEQRFKEKYGQSATQTAETYVRLANFLSEKGKNEAAVSVLKANVRLNPDFPPYYGLLAKAHLASGDGWCAKWSYKRAYELAKASTTGAGNAESYLEQSQILNKGENSATSMQPNLTSCI